MVLSNKGIYIRDWPKFVSGGGVGAMAKVGGVGWGVGWGGQKG